MKTHKGGSPVKPKLTRRSFLAGTAMAAAAAQVRAAGGPAEPDPRPNVLWICTDQQRYDTIASLGNPHLRTPNIDRLVESGVAFTHAHCQSPICTPSRASFLTGLYPDTVHGCTNGNDHWDEAAPLVTATLAAAGYDCGLSGKLHLSAAQGRIEKRPRDDGYRVFHWSHHPKPDWPEGHAYDDWLKGRGEDYNTLYRRHGYIPTPLHQTTWCTEMAVDFLKDRRKGPWLFSLNCFDPHPPFDPPQEFLDRFDVASMPGPLFRESDLEAQERLSAINFQSKPRRPEAFDAKLRQAQYWAQIELIDQNVGRLLNALDETGQRENTIVIFTSDHGTALGDHGLVAKGCRFYEGLVRVPLIFSWPGRFQKGLKSDALVELTDIVPTLLEASGLPVPERMHGRSLGPILEGRSDPHAHREFVRSIFFRVLEGPETCASMIRTRRHKLVAYHGLNLGELFDLEADPGEFDNLWQDPAAADIRFDLLAKAFDAAAFAADVGSQRVGRF
jgi:arylsulfatase A-like enzyme